MSKIFLFLTMVLVASTALARDYVYYGTWVTTQGRQLDGTMTCVLTPTAKHRYNGRFYGVWMGVPFDYTVPITGPIQKLQGTAEKGKPLFANVSAALGEGLMRKGKLKEASELYV